MALSSYDTFLIDENNQPISEFTSHLGVKVEVRKNWLYISDKVAWEKNCGYTENTVLHINSGDLKYKDVNILAITGPQSGIYFAVWSQKITNIDNQNTLDYRGMVGIGCYAFEEDNFVGIKTESIQYLQSNLLQSSYRVMMSGDDFGLNLKEIKLPDPVWPNAKLIGDNTFEFDQYQYEIPDVLRNLDLQSIPGRFNQGDKYFEKHLDIPCKHTLPNDSETPILLK